MTEIDRKSGKHEGVTHTVTFERDGEQMAPVAVCPRRLTLLRVAECRGCADFMELRINPASGAPFLRCAANPVLGVEPADPEGPRIADLMAQPPPSTRLEATLSEVLAGPLSQGEAVAVACGSGHLIGLITRAAVLQRLYERSQDEAPTFGLAEAAESTYVRDMTLSPTFRVSSDAPAAQVAALMAFERIGEVLVIDEAGALVGMVSALDFARWIACRNGYVVPSER